MSAPPSELTFSFGTTSLLRVETGTCRTLHARHTVRPTMQAVLSGAQGPRGDRFQPLAATGVEHV